MEKESIHDNRCTGCQACVSICPQGAIAMKPDDKGFLYPVIDRNKCIGCNLCSKVCMYQSKSDQYLNKNIKTYAAKSRDNNILSISTSGGIFTELSNIVLNQNGVIYGAAYDEKLSVKHIRVTNKEELKLLNGSKYVQSNINNIFKSVLKDLKSNRTVLFSGTPCQILGLKKYLNKEYDQLILVDIVCHGVPSPKIFDDYIKYIEKKRKQKITNFIHRSKKINWKYHLEEIEYANGKKEYISSLSQSWKKVFFSHNALRESCYKCQFTKKDRVSDITLGDFWGIDKIDPQLSIKNGVSLVLINTKKGENIFNEIKKNIDCKEHNIDDAAIYNPQLKRNVIYSKDEQLKFWNIYNKFGIEKILKIYGDYNIKDKIKNVFRIFKQKILKYKTK